MLDTLAKVELFNNTQSLQVEHIGLRLRVQEVADILQAMGAMQVHSS